MACFSFSLFSSPVPPLRARPLWEGGVVFAILLLLSYAKRLYCIRSGVSSLTHSHWHSQFVYVCVCVLVREWTPPVEPC
ncbi:hypothetical protein T492DRAFT_1109958 [Pavlovales sp. CCMP2436]|nr:hypothetical protein T492DRAFT_1109958 [Pavlovales sp. CCMP2436]